MRSRRRYNEDVALASVCGREVTFAIDQGEPTQFIRNGGRALSWAFAAIFVIVPSQRPEAAASA